MNYRGPLRPENWDLLAPLLDKLLDAQASERSMMLDRLAGNDPARRSELERLLADCERDLSLLDRPAAEVFTQLLGEDPGPALPEVLGGRYRIERELGRGGMARVYLAHDLRHARRVAVKVIRHEIAASLGRDRFLREIGIAARLRHPNIMPLYDSGDVDGLLYFVMPYEEGKSLRARLDRQPGLSIAEGVSILRDVARALACAHEQSVVHRDIKPDNVLLSGDAAVVTDFGIAKALSVAATESGTETVTQAGTVIGTPAYMSPEQALGDPATDHRADIYAFGCVAYEIFAGTPPFKGATTHQVIAAKLSERLTPLSELRPDVPAALPRLIERCLERDPDARPATAAELLDVLGSMTTATRELGVLTHRKRRWLAAAALALVVAGLGGWYAVSANRGGPVTLSVLPLQVTGDSAQALASGFTDEVARALVRKPWLLVKSRGGARNYIGRGEIDTRAAGDSLGVRYLLMLSYQQEGNGVSVILQLIRSADDGLVWAEKFSNPTNLEALRDEIATAVSDTLRRVAGRFARSFADTAGGAQAARRRPGSSDAYRLYVIAKRRSIERDRSMLESIAEFRQAIALDSTFAGAWSGLSVTLALSAMIQGVHIDSVREEATASARRAAQLDPTYPEPHVALGVLHALNRQWRSAETEFRTAVRIDPTDAEARVQYARMLFLLGRLPEAHAQIDAALENDPASSLVLAMKSLNYYLRDQLDTARVWSDRAIQVNESNHIARYFRSLLLLQQNRKAEAREIALRAPIHEAYSIFVLAAAGDSASVRERIEWLSSRDHPLLETARAYALLGFGDTTAALDALDRATRRREAWHTISYPGLHVFDSVRSSPRFRALVRTVGLPEL